MLFHCRVVFFAKYLAKAHKNEKPNAKTKNEKGGESEEIWKSHENMIRFAHRLFKNQI